MKKLRFLALLTALAMAAGCSANPAAQTQTPAGQTADEQTAQAAQPQRGEMPAGMPGGMPGFGAQELTEREYPQLRAEYSDRDLSGEYDESAAAKIALSGSTAEITGDGAMIENGTITITEAGVYILSGALSGEIIVDAPDDAKIQLVLNNAEINSSTGSAIHIKQADKVFITLPSGTQNAVSDAAEYENAAEDKAPDAAIFSRADTTINGSGALAVAANFKDGIVCKDDLKIVNASLTVSAPNHGIVGKDLLALKAVNFSVTSGKDALKSDNEDEGKGALIIDSGEFQINAADDGISSETDVFIYDGNINIASSTEGIEGKHVSILGGNISIRATDDGINASTPSSGSKTEATDPRMGGGGMQNEADTYILIAGGEITISADSDCVDSNGDILQTGGTLLTSGPAQGDGNPIDPNGASAITGGYTAAAGGQMMTSNFGASSTQASILIAYPETQSAGTRATLCDSAGNALLTFAPENDYTLIIFSSPDIAVGETYTLYTGGDCATAFAANATLSGGEKLCDLALTEQNQSFNSDGTAYSGFGGMGDFGGFGGGRGGMTPPDGFTPPDGMEPPDGFTPPDGFNPPNGEQPQTASN